MVNFEPIEKKSKELIASQRLLETCCSEMSYIVARSAFYVTIAKMLTLSSDKRITFRIIFDRDRQ